MEDWDPFEDFTKAFTKAAIIAVIVVLFCCCLPIDGRKVTRTGIVVSTFNTNWPCEITTITLTNFGDRSTQISFEGKFTIQVGNLVEIQIQHKAWHFYDTMISFSDLGPSRIYTEKR